MCQFFSLPHHSYSPKSLILVPPVPGQRDRIRVLTGGVLAAAGGVLVQVLRLLPSVPRSSLAALGLALEPLHQHGVSAEEGERLSDGAAAAN